MLHNDENALTFEAGNAPARAARIETLIACPVLRLILARSGRARVLEQFTLSRMVDDLEAWLTSISAGRPTRRGING